jgi:hypothetical protein
MTIANYTFLELQEEVLSFQFQPQKYRPLVKKWLNQAVRKIIIAAEIRTSQGSETITTLAGDPSYTMPEGFARLIDFFYPAAPRLMTAKDIRDFDLLPEASGQPTAYTVRSNELFLWPTPDGAYGLTMRFWRLPQDMVNDSDIPALPVQYHEDPIAYAMWKCYLRENDYQAAKVWQELWEGELLKMRGEAQGEVFDGPRQVSGTWGDPHGTPVVGG